MIEGDRVGTCPHGDRAGILSKQLAYPFCSAFVLQCVGFGDCGDSGDPWTRDFAQWRKEQTVYQESAVRQEAQADDGC